MADIFANYSGLIVFLHVLSALIWVGGMIAIKFAVSPVVRTIDDEKLRLNKLHDITSRFLKIVLPFTVLIVLTAVIMLIGIGFKGTPLNGITHIKEAIWVIMSINLVVIFFKNKKIGKLLVNNDVDEAKTTMALISNIMLPVNILLGIVAVYLGVALRGF